MTSVEIDSVGSGMAAAHLERAGLHAHLVLGDAGEALRDAPDRAYDFAFLDAERPA